MDMMRGAEIASAGLTDWRKLAQGLHARYVVDDLRAGVRFLAAISDACDELGHQPTATIGPGYVDLELVSDDAIYRDSDGVEHVVEWVTQQDVDLARRITQVASEHGLTTDPASVCEIELGLDTSTSSTIAPVWAALLTGDAGAQGRGTPGDEIRDATRRVPNLWFGDADADGQGQRFHVEVYAAAEAVADRVAAAVAAGGTVVDDSNAPSLTVIAHQDGNQGVICADTSAAGAG